MNGEAKARWALPESWVWTTMGEAAEIVGGSTPSTDEPENFASSGIPWITPADLSGYKAKLISRGSRDISEKGLASSATRLMPASTVLFSSRAPIGYVAIAANPVATNQGFKSFILSKGILPDYTYYWLIRAKHLLSEFASGTTFLEISGKRAHQIPLPIAPLDEQRRIVNAIESLLPKLDAAVATLERVRANLKRYRASVLKAAVEGHLVPTEAELACKEGRDFEPASVLLERILAERRRRWEESEPARMKAAGKPPKDDRWKSKYKEPVPPDTTARPQLPGGWCWASLESLCFTLTDGDHQPPPQTEEGVPFLVIGNIRNGRLDFANSRFVSKEYYEAIEGSRRPDLGDILYSVTGSFGIPVVVNTQAEFCVQRHIAILKPVSNIRTRLLSHFLASRFIYRQAESAATGTAQMTVPLKGLRAIVVPLPPAAEQKRLCAEVERLLSLAEKSSSSCELGIQRCARLRQAILKWAFEGKLVDQDPDEELASVLLERIRAERAATAPSAKNRKTSIHQVEAAK